MMKKSYSQRRKGIMDLANNLMTKDTTSEFAKRWGE